MLSFSSFVFSCRMRLLKLKNHKVAVSVVVLALLFGLILGPPLYEESWLDPFNTLNIPNREFHPHAITMLGMINSNDPYHPYYFTDKAKISELIHDLQRSAPVSITELTPNFLDNNNVKFLTLHRASSKYHSEEDYALQYYPDNGVVRFGQQLFHINEATIYALSQITSSMKPGWW